MSSPIRTSQLMMAALVALAASGIASAHEIDSARYDDPRIDLAPEVRAFSPRLKPLWLEALARSEVDLKRQAAHTIVLARQRGMPNLADTAGPLLEVLDATKQHPVVQLACVRALIALDAREAAESLFQHAQNGRLSMAQLVEPALARWDYHPIRSVWLGRIANENQHVSHGRLRLAIRGLAFVGEPKAAPPLRQLALAPEGVSYVRIEAARALGQLQSDGLADDARTLTLGNRASGERVPTTVDRLIAASLLASHRGELAESILLKLAVDDEPAVAAMALGRLIQIDPLLVVPVVEPTIRRADATVRWLGARTLVAWRTPKAIRLLGTMLADPDPGIRAYACRSLLQMRADPPETKRADRVLREALAMLATDRWRGLEQAVLMVAAIDHKPAANRLLELLDFERPEVGVAAAWALRRLAVSDTLGPMLEKARRETQAPNVDAGDQLVHLFEAFGQMGYQPAGSLLEELIPRSVPFDPKTRGAAIWALGHLHAGKPNPALAKQLVGRLSDVMSLDPEALEVRRMAAIALGRMRAEQTLPTLRRFLGEETLSTEVGCACAWAIHQITGEPIPIHKTVRQPRVGWFLEPVDDPDGRLP